jgi:hypothetical protein
MTDDQSDSWRSLADQLGVQPGEQPSAPSPSSASSPPPAKYHSQPASASKPASPPKKADWNALAGELGLEVSPEPKSDSAPHDPVAELLGFPPPSAVPPQREQKQNRGQEEPYGPDDQSDRSSNRDRWRDEDEDGRRSNVYDDTKPVYDDTRPADLSGNEAGDFRDRPASDQPRSYRPGRRRGGRGRGGVGRGGADRGGEGRGARYGNQDRERRPYGERQYGQHDSQSQQSDENAASDRPSASDESTAESNVGNRVSRDDRTKRRRRGRGRGGRGDRPQHQRPTINREESDRPADEDDIPFLELADDTDLTDDVDVASVEFGDVDFTEADDRLGLAPNGSEAIDHDDQEDALGDSDDSHDENHVGKNSVRDIMTWKDAIGMIIDGNMQTRAQSPHSSQHPRGQRGGRGRGRGRGGHRR